MSVEPWSPAAFEERYRRAADPWDFADSPYEQGRYQAIIDSLPRARYRFAFEPGCSIGELTWRLSQRCDRVLAIDVSETAAAAATERCRQLPGVEVRVGSVADHVATGLDLVVLSEIGYYFTVAELDDVLDRLVGALGPGDDLVACHWTGRSPDHRLSGHTVHERLDAHPGLRAGHHADHDGFLIATFTVADDRADGVRTGGDADRRG